MVTTSLARGTTSLTGLGIRAPRHCTRGPLKVSALFGWDGKKDSRNAKRDEAFEAQQEVLAERRAKRERMLAAAEVRANPKAAARGKQAAAPPPPPPSKASIYRKTPFVPEVTTSEEEEDFEEAPAPPAKSENPLGGLLGGFFKK